tara:strand:- start:1459 stop:1908 length:450 start_codon:yes stop_codon:yes gene_type:complete
MAIGFGTLLSAGMGIWGGLQAQAAADTSAAMAWSTADRKFTNEKYGMQAGMGMSLAQMNNNALAQKENARNTKDVALWGAKVLSDEKGRAQVRNFERMLGAQNSEKARDAQRFQGLLNATGQGLASRSNAAGWFGPIAQDHIDRSVFTG